MRRLLMTNHARMEKLLNHLGSSDSHRSKLLRNLHGLKDAGATWFNHLCKGLTKDLNFKQSLVDPCQFYQGQVILRASPISEPSWSSQALLMSEFRQLLVVQNYPDSN